jgi:hypothetical protein
VITHRMKLSEFHQAMVGLQSGGAFRMQLKLE